MTMELYQFPPSPPCQMVRLLAAQMDLEMDMKDVNVPAGEHLLEEYIKINPQHTIPTLVDGDCTITESRAILMYLVNKYGDDDANALYPTNPEKRAIIDMRLCFDISTLYVKLCDAYFRVIWHKVPVDEENAKKLDEVLSHVENFLEDGFIAGSELTIADFSYAVILTILEGFGHDISAFPRITEYLEKCKEVMKGWDEVINQNGANVLIQFFKASLAEAEG